MKKILFLCISIIGCADYMSLFYDVEKVKMNESDLMIDMMSMQDASEMLVDIDVDFEMDQSFLDMKNTTGRGFGAECYQPTDCESLNCLFVNGGVGVCTVPCDIANYNCPDAIWECQLNTSLGDVCVPMTVKNTCDPCTTDVDCGEEAACAIALDDFSKKYCMPTCVSATDCEEGFRCYDIGASSLYCVPVTAEACIR